MPEDFGLMLKETWKQNLVLIGFAFLLSEYLTLATMIFVAVGVLLVSLNIRPGKVVRNAIALGVFASYWIKYGKLIDPEIGLNFLTSIIMLKIVEKETVRDRYMIFFGLILLLSAGTLFERTLTYVFFFTFSFLLLIQDFYSYLGQRWKVKDFALAFLWVLPLTFGLFFFVPRLINPIPFQQASSDPGEIGYTPDVNISEVESIEANQSTVFQVSVSRKLNQSELYWRGNTLAYTDGWNWREKKTSYFRVPVKEYFKASADIEQKFRLFIRPDYFFSLDYPKFLSYRGTNIRVDNMERAIPQGRWEGIQRYSVLSDPYFPLLDKDMESSYLQVPLSRKMKEQISSMFPGQTLDEVTSSIRRHFGSNGFMYSLSPGKTPRLQDFLNKKIGFCSHYASATALILRMKGIPARLVSGFMGGNYNRFADFYQVGQNDAHVWVEALSDGQWVRLDPTEWIAPDRVLLGGEAFMENVSEGVFRKQSLFRIPGIFQEMKLWFQQWDYVFYAWLEEMDYHAQEAWFHKINIKRRWVYSILPAMILIFMLLYMLHLKLKESSGSTSPHQELWSLFIKRMKKKGVEISRHSLAESREAMEKQKGNLDSGVFEIWDELVSFSFGTANIAPQVLKRKIKRL